MSIYQEKVLGLKSIDKDSPFFICTLFSYIVLKKIVNLSHKGLFDEFEYNLGKKSAKLLCKLQIKQGLKGASGIKAAFEEFENMGFGITKIVLLKKNNCILKNLTTPIARQFVKSFFEDKIKTDYYIAGVYSGILSSYFKKNIEIEEQGCNALGSEECTFINTNRVPNRYNLAPLVQKVIQKQQLFSKKRIRYPNNFCIEMLHRRIYHKNKGIIKMANIYHVFFRFSFFMVSNHILSKKAKDAYDLHEYVGYAQGMIATAFQKNQFGRKEPDDIFNELLTHLNMSGYGVPLICSRTGRQIIIKFKGMLSLKQALQFMEKFDDPYLRGLLLGFSTVYSKPVSSIEFTNRHQDELTAKISFGHEDLAQQLSKNIKSNRIKCLAMERMQHKYYLSPS